MKNSIYLMLLLSFNTFSQNLPPVIKLNIIVTSEKKQKKILKDVKISFNNKIVNHLTTNSYDEFEFDIEQNRKLLITFEKEGFFPKTILVDSKCSNEGINVREFYIQLVMDKKEDQEEYTDFSFPLVKINYCKQSKKYKYNRLHNTEMRNRYQKLLKKLEKDQLASID